MESPRIYVASLSDYNNGRLEGKWFDFDDYSDASELMDAITDMLDEITKKYNDGEEREEWAVHDYEYIPSTLATEYMGERDFQTIYDIVEASEENGIPNEVLMERVGDTGSDDYRSIAESLMFVVDGNDESDIVYELEEQIGELGFDFWQNHIYIDDVTQRVMYGEDVDRYREDIQYDNPDMDEDEVERLAEEQADDEENRRNDDLIGYLEEMGYEDIPTWVSKDYESAWKSALSYDYDIISYDGKMYVFSINYSQGGNVMYDNGGQVQISEEDLAKIRQVIAEEQAKNKGFLGRMQDNYLQSQVSPKEAMQFVKDNPEVLKLLMVLEKGGKVDSENYEMLRGKIKELMHHAKELKSITNRKKQVPAWVLAKSTRASTDLSDITHYMDGNKFGKGGGVESKIDMLYKKSNFINADFNWQGKLIEMLQDNSIDAYNIYQSLTKEQKESVLQEQYELDNDMGSDGDGEIETSKENLEILLQDAKNGNKYANGGGVDYKEQQINDLNNWDNHEIANFLGVSISQVAKDRQRYIREAQSVMMLDSYSNGGGVGDNRLLSKLKIGNIIPTSSGNFEIIDFEEETNKLGIYDGGFSYFKVKDENGKIQYIKISREKNPKMFLNNGSLMSSSWQNAKQIFSNGGGITDYNWANEFRKTKKYFVVILAEENGEEEIFEGNVQARSESEALSEARRGFEFNYPNKMIKKASIDKTKDTNRYEEGGNVSGLNDLIYG